MISAQRDVSGCYTPCRHEHEFPTGYWLYRADPAAVCCHGNWPGWFQPPAPNRFFDHRMLLIAKYRFAAFFNPACLSIHARLRNFNDLHQRLSIRLIIPIFPIIHHFISRTGFRFARTLRNARITWQPCLTIISCACICSFTCAKQPILRTCYRQAEGSEAR